jgi:bacillithiol biosynthesis cysteine-adding enzyme BshC
VREFYPVDFRDPAAMVRAADARGYPAARRAAMAAILKAQAERIGFGEVARGPLERFQDPRAVVVVAGQQPGLFGGPLYTLYKAMTAIHLARAIEKATGRPAVPIFWVASDDHDFEEVRRTWVSDGTELEPTLVEYPQNGIPPSLSFSRIRIGADVGPLLERLQSLLPESPFRDGLLLPLREAYAPGRGWAESFARFMATFVAPLGALVLDPADREAKALAIPVFEREIDLLGSTARAARARGEELTGRGYHAQIAREGNELNLFWHGEDGRQSIRVEKDGSLRLTGPGTTWTADRLKRAVRERPEDASPGVLLRPIVQDHLLPTAAYVGGPSEVAYWAQVFPVYDAFGMSPPAIAPRSGATLLEPKVERTLQKFGIGWERLAGDPEVVIRDTMKALLPEDFQEVFALEREAWRESFRRVEEKVASFDPSLRPAVTNAQTRLEREIETLEKKLLTVWKRRQEESVTKIRRARESLFPHGGLQERVCSPLGFAARHGPWLITRLEESLGEPGSHTLVLLGGEGS